MKMFITFIQHIKLLLGLIFFVPMALNAQSLDQFTVKDIKIEANSKDGSTVAREKAITQATKQAFDILLTRLVISQQDNIPEFTSEEINSMVQEISIKNEKISNNYYSALIDITFSEDYVKSIIKANNIPTLIKERTQKSKVLLLPYTLSDNIQHAIHTDNGRDMWFAIWKTMLAEHNTQIEFLIPEQEEIGNANINYNEIATIPELLPYLENLQQEDCVVISKAQNYSIDDHIILKVDNEITCPDYVEKRVFNFDGAAGEDVASVLTSAANVVKNYIKKQIVGVDASYQYNANLMQFKIPVSNLDEWLNTRHRLDGLAFIKNLNVKEITTNAIKVDMSFDASAEEVDILFANNGFYIQEEGNDLILLSAGRNRGWFIW